jgi:hypothetical protein
MANELVASFLPGDLTREQSVGYNRWAYVGGVGSFCGCRLNKLDNQGYVAIVKIPPGLTMATGLTFSWGFCDNAEFSSDPGLVVRFGITVKRLIAGETPNMDAAAGAEQFVNVTTQGTSGNLTIGTLAIANANLDSAAVGDRIGIRLRRNGTNAADTFQGSVLVTDLSVINT